MKKLKKLLIIALCMAMIMGMTACGNKDEDSKKESKKTESADKVEKEEKEDDEDNEEDGDASEESKLTILEDNGNLLDDFEGHEEDELTEVVDIIFTAFQKLDPEPIKPFISEEKYSHIELEFNSVKENPEDLEFWNNTIGLMKYFPDSDVLIAKSVEYVKSAWYTDCWKNNAEIPAEESYKFSKEYLMDIYNKYYVNAPYVAGSDLVSRLDFEVEDGYIKCSMDEILDVFGYDSLAEIFNLNTDGGIRAGIMLPEIQSLSLGYDYILTESNGEPKIPDVAALLEKDLNKMIEIADASDALEEGNLYTEAYNMYYKNEEYKSILQKIFTEECEVYRDLSSVTYFIPADLENTYPYEYLSDADRAVLEGMGEKFIMEKVIFEFPSNWGNSFSPYYNLIELAKYRGLIE